MIIFSLALIKFGPVNSDKENKRAQAWLKGGKIDSGESEKGVSSYFADGRQVNFSDLFGRSLKDGNERLFSDKMRFKRACDLFIPSLPNSEYIEHSLNPGGFRELISQLVAVEFTGCMLVTNDVFISRGAILLYRGMCAGAVYSNNFGKAIHTTDGALATTFQDAKNAECQVVTYDLPESIVLAHSALFFGNTMEYDENSFGIKYLEVLMETIEAQKSTGVINVGVEKGNNLSFVFYYQGCFTGYFRVQERLLGDVVEDLMQYLRSNVVQKVNANILPAESLKSAERFFYGLKVHFPGL